MADLLLLSTLSQHALEAMLGRRADVLTVGIAMVLALGFQPLRARVRTLADRLLPLRQELAPMFTDIVGSTARLATLGDSAWRDVLANYRATVQRELRRHGAPKCISLAAARWYSPTREGLGACDLSIEDCGVHSLKGIPEQLRLHLIARI